MSLKNAKATEMGLFLSSAQKKTLILPFSISLMEQASPEKKFAPKLNKILYRLLTHSIARYSLVFEKGASKKPIVKLLVYLSSSSIKTLQHKTKQLYIELIQTFKELHLHLRPVDSKGWLEELQSKIPSQVEENSSGLFKITTAKETSPDSVYYLVAKKITFASLEHEQELYLLINDFFAEISNGKIVIDIQNPHTNPPQQKEPLASVVAVLTNTSLDDIKNDQKKFSSCLRLFNEHRFNKTVSVSFEDRESIFDNFGKILLGQGWAHKTTAQTGLLDYATLLGLLFHF